MSPLTHSPASPGAAGGTRDPGANPCGHGDIACLSLRATDDKAACALPETLMLDRVRVGGRWYDRRLFLLDAFINYYLYCCHFFSREFLQPRLWVRAAISGQGDCNLPRRLEAGWQAGQRWPGQFVLLKAWLLMPTALSKILVWIQCLSALFAAREKSAAAAEPGKRPRGGIANVTELTPRG